MDQGYQPDSANMPEYIEAPRGYQNELLERAKKENIIAFAATGSGKTLIALYLIKHVLSQPSLEKKTAVFVVDRVMLAWQQSDYLRKGMEGEGNSVGLYYGDLGLDDWSGERWLHELAEKRVLVMTAQVFLNALRHGVLDMSTVAILVFDEAHHATGQHPFRRIMIEFYHTLPVNVVKPRVFGMTASPVKTKSSTRTRTECGEAIAMLQVTMDAVVVSVSEDAQKELESLIPSAAEYVLEYETQENSQIEAEEESQVDELATASGLDVPLQSVLSSASARNGSSRNGVSLQGRSEHSLTANPPPQQLTQILQKMHSMLGARVSTYLADQFRSGRKLSNDTMNPSDIQYGGDVITEKVSTLLKLLVSERLRWLNQSNGSDGIDSCFRCIVFVQERVAAFALAWLINDILGQLELKCLTARAVIGCSHRSTHLRMSKAQQDEILKGFRHGSYGILVATNVVEEGLDIPACSLVVSFDPITSTRAYVQSRGRARHEGSRYIILIPKGSEGRKLALAKVYEGIGVTRSVVQTFNAGELNSKRWKAELEAQAKKIHDEEYVNILCSRTTSARVFASSVLHLIKVYCLGLSCDRSEPAFTEREDGNLFFSTIELPDPSPVRSASSSSPQTTIIMARRMAGLAAYKKLYECGEVDEYLLPKVRRRQASESDEAQEPRRGRYRRPRSDRASTRIRDCSIRQPVALLRRSAVARYNGELGIEELHNIHLYRIIPHPEQHPLASQEYWPGCSTYGIGLEHKLLEEDLEAFLCPTGERLLTLEYLGDVPWSAEKDTLCRRYMAAIRGCSVGHYPEWLFDSMITELPVVDTLPETTQGYTRTSNGAHEAHYSSDSASEDENYNSIPLSMKAQEEQVIALDYGGPLKEGNNETNGCREYEKQKGVPGLYFLPLANDTHDFQSRGTVDWRQVEELSAFSLAGGPGKHLSSELAHQFVISSHESSNRIYFTGNVLDGVTPSTAAHPLLARKYRTIRGYYSSRHNIDLSDDQASFLEGFSVSKLFNGQRKHKFPLCSSFLFRIPLSPWAVFISSLLPGWQVCITLRDAWRKICPNRSIKFLSFTRAVQPNTGSLARDFPNLNYERAEFLGDAVLKLVSSMMAYATAPSDDEGLMTDARDEEVSNDKLCNIAVSIGIPRCIAFTSVTRNVKKWPWYWAAPQFAKISISEKVLADCVEALIGSHYLEGGVSSAIRFMNTYGIVKNAQVLLNFQYNPREGVPESRADLTRLTDPRLAVVEGTINYRFESKSILVEALTHGSYRSGNARSYQRLEFLGDAVVGFVLLSRFYEEFPSFSPGELSAMREPALSNDIFARVVVDHELHRSLWFDCRALDRDIRIFAELLKDEKEGEDVCKTLTVPKVLGDILEALVGAVVVDQRMHLEAVEDVVFLLMESALERFVNPANLTGNPVSKLSRLVQGACGETPRFEYHEFTASSANGIINTPDYGRPMRNGMPFAARHVEETVAKCKVFVKGKEIASGTGPNRRVAKHRASHNALQTEAFDRLLNHQAEENCNSSS